MTTRRAIFEEVSARAAPAAAPGAADRARARARLWVAGWLAVLAALVSTMVLVGGMTRLTDSGLSMVSWHPVLEVVPPVTEEDWAREFEKYRTTEQYRQVNSWMGVEDFKSIYWWEWGHRQFGRLIGVVWAVGLGTFLALRMLPAGFFWPVTIPGLLGGVQALIGMWMVDSGVAPGSTLISVAPYRLALHLGLAFLILGLLLWPLWRLLRPEVALLQARRRRTGAAMALTGAFVGLTFAQIVLGALVAGNDAGRAYVDWPFFLGEWFPASAFALEPAWRNFVEGYGLTQFNHRVAGYALGLLSLAAVAAAWRSGRRELLRWTGLAAIAVWAQMAWGILTLVNGAPVGLALVHQAGAMLTLGLVLRARFEAAYPAERSALRA